MGLCGRVDVGGMQTAAGASFRSRLYDAVLGERFRSRRVLTLLAGVILLSVGDLYMTLLHLKSFGLIEANPLARGIMAHHSAAGLVVWKTATVGLAVGILYFTRRRGAAEIGAIISCLVLSWLTLRWVTYSDQVSGMIGEMQALESTGEEPRFVTMTQDAE
jgi:hypothetical protein